MNLKVICGDALTELKKLPDESVHCCVTSPPYWGLRDYGVDGQLGLERTPEEYVSKLVEIFGEVRRVLRDDGTAWLNLGDTYAGNGAAGQATEADTRYATVGALLSLAQRRQGRVDGLKAKDLVGIPWRVAFALQASGWYLRSDIIWAKPNPMPESVTDRPTKAHEYLFLLSKSECYYYDAEAIKEPSVDNWTYGQEKRLERILAAGGALSGGTGEKVSLGSTRNRRSVWITPTNPYPEAHFATYPPDLIKPCILAGCTAGGTVLDPFAGSGTTGQVALELGRGAILIELNPKYIPLIEARTNVTPGLKI